MTYPLTYGPQPQQVVYNTETKKSSVPAFIGGAAVGGIGGAIVASKKNPFITKNGTFRESFLEKVFNNYIKNANATSKATYEYNSNFLNELKTVTNMQEFNALKNSHTEFFNNLKLDTQNITETNLKENLNTIKQQAQTDINTFKQNFRNKLHPYWNKDKSTFQNLNTTGDDIGNAISKTIKGVRFKNIMKYTGIGAVATGAVAFALHKILSYKNSLPKQ